NELPSKISNAYAISASGLLGMDQFHFDLAGQRELGKRYGEQMESALNAQQGDWVGTWAAGPQLTEPGNLPPEPGLATNTLRQVIFTSIGGEQLRLQLSNAYGTSPLEIGTVHVASSTAAGDIDPATDTALTFDGSPSVTIPAGETRFSDPLNRAVS